MILNIRIPTICTFQSLLIGLIANPRHLDYQVGSCFIFLNILQNFFLLLFFYCLDGQVILALSCDYQMTFHALS